MFIDESFPPNRASLGRYESIGDISAPEKQDVDDKVVWRRVIDTYPSNFNISKSYID